MKIPAAIHDFHTSASAHTGSHAAVSYTHLRRDAHGDTGKLRERCGRNRQLLERGETSGAGSKARKDVYKRQSKSSTPLATPKPLEGFSLPPMDLLARSSGTGWGASEADLRETAACLQETLEDFNILAEVVGWVAGPTVTLFKVDLPAGVRVSLSLIHI